MSEDFEQYRPEADPLVGSKLGDRYEIISVIASGGMGVVYRGRHILMDKIVAIKMLNAAYATESGAFTRFQNEAKIACQLSHPNIVTVHDFGIAENKMYLVMDFVDGQTLAQILDDRTFLPAKRVKEIGVQICNALEYAHEQELIHRDLKPGNIMIAPSKDGIDQVKILDFGLAKFFGEGKQQQLSQSGYMLGTGFYMSPEQCRGKKADIRSEIYSLACVLYEALTGVPPLVGDNVLETVQKHIEENAVPMSELRPELEIPSDMETIVNKGLAKDPDARYQSAAEVKSALETAKLVELESAAAVSPNETKPKIGGLPLPALIASIVFCIAVPCVIFLNSKLIAEPGALRDASAADGGAIHKTPLPVSKDWSNAYREALKAFDKEEYESAEKLLERTISISKASGNEWELLPSLRKMQDVLYVQRKFKEADSLDAEILRLTASGITNTYGNPSTMREPAVSQSKDVKAQKTVETRDGKTSDTAQSEKSRDERIAQLAMFCHEKGQCGTAIKLLEHSVEIAKKMHGDESLQTASRLEELASLHMALDESDEAQPLMKQAMNIRAKLAGKSVKGAK